MKVAKKQTARKRKPIRKDFKGDNIYLTEEERRTPRSQPRKWQAPEDMPDTMVRKVLAGKVCGALLKGWKKGTNKNGNKYCTARPIPGKNIPYRCRMHGGSCPGGPPGPEGAIKTIKHGLYSKCLLEGEEEEFERLCKEVETNLDREIAITKLRLQRVMKAEADVQRKREEGELLTEEEAELVSFEVTEGMADSGAFRNVKVVKQIPDYRKQVHQVVLELVKLEQTRMAAKAGGTGAASPTEKAAMARQFLKEANEAMKKE